MVRLVLDLNAFPEGPKARVPEMRNAYRYLRGTHSSVDGLISTARRMIDDRRAVNASDVGRLHTNEIDVLRAAIVFTSSGIDASMKRLVNDVGRYLIERTKQTRARAEFERFVKSELAKAKIADGLRNAIMDREATTALVTFYLTEKTRASFQGSGDLERRVKNTLGITNSQVSALSLKSLDPFFIARNSIAHSMDYKKENASASKARTHRSFDEVVMLCNTAFDVSATLMHAAADVLVSER
jgi:hypothetical protein